MAGEEGAGRGTRGDHGPAQYAAADGGGQGVELGALQAAVLVADSVLRLGGPGVQASASSRESWAVRARASTTPLPSAFSRAGSPSWRRRERV
ncbi:hypothetical protein SF23_04520 [Streptomyces sp. MBRL 10]|nr:hypothetical protein SF23_04520 [Streptomyces sp. MBRL 10]